MDVKILAMSDLHGQLPKIDDYVDIIILAGDISPRINNKLESLTWFLTDFIKWIKTFPDAKIIFVPGNNDSCFTDPEMIYAFKKIIYSMGIREFYMENCTLWGINFQVSSALRYWGDHPFMMKADQLKLEYDKLTKCDVLITHEAPAVKGMPEFLNPSESDPNYGSSTLFERICQIKPKYHIFGHVHDAVHSFTEITPGTKAVCVSLCDEFNNPKYKPFKFTVCTSTHIIV